MGLPMLFYLAFALALVSADYADDQTAWLAENAKVDGVKTTDSGLQYLVLEEGDLKHYPTAADKVKVHYTGYLTDGSKFDSSVDRNRPAEFPLRNVIAGWTEGVQLQSVGSKFKFFIPSSLGYGARGAGAKIPGHSTLIFEVQLLGINGNE